MFGLVYSPWERVTTSRRESQVSLFLLLIGTLLSLVYLLSPYYYIITSDTGKSKLELFYTM